MVEWFKDLSEAWQTAIFGAGVAVAIAGFGGLFTLFKCLFKRKNGKQVLISQGSLDNYISESKYVAELSRRISGIRNAQINNNGLPALLYPFVISQLNYLGLQTISDIDKILEKSVDTIAQFYEALNEENINISKADCIKILCNFLMAKNRSVDQIVSYYDANSLNTKDERLPYAKRIKNAYNKTVNPEPRYFKEITNGSIIYRSNTVNLKPLIDLKMTIVGGYIKRNDFGKIEVYIRTDMPFQPLQRLNEKLGLDSMRLLSERDTISVDTDNPTVFTSSTSHILPEGEMVLDLSTWQEVPFPMTLHVQTQTKVSGHLTGKVFQGKFEAIITYQELDSQIGIDGDCQVHLV